MKINFQDFQSRLERRDFLYNKIDSKNYFDEDVENQIETLKLMVNKIKKDYNEGKDIEEATKNVERYIYNFIINDISKPTFNDFYVPRTQEYLSKNEDCLKESIENFIKNQKNYKRILYNAGDKTTENLNQNIDIIIATLLSTIEKMQYIKSDNVLKLQEKIRLGKLDIGDKDTVFLCINKLLKEAVNNYRDNCCKSIERNPEKVYRKLMSNIDNIFEVNKLSDMENKSNGIKEDRCNIEQKNKLNDLISSTSIIKSLTYTQTFDIETITIKKFLTNPFYGDNEADNLLIFLGELLTNVDNASIKYFYNKLKESKQDSKAKEKVLEVIKENAKICKQDNLKTMLSNRVAKLVEMQDSIGYIDRCNNTNNSRLLELGLDGLTIESEELKTILESSKHNSISSTEVGTALSAFYINRTAKIVPAFLRSAFILDKNKVFDKIYENPQIKFEDLGLSVDTVKQNMAEYDGIHELITQRCINNKKATDKDKSEIPDIDLEAIKLYKNDYEKKYHNFYKDFKNVLGSVNYKRFFYLIKDFSISALIYTALTNSKNGIINWGYVLGDTNTDKEKILLGFDIESLNMPLFLHMNREDLTQIVNRITGQNIIPVYEGSSDWTVSFNKSGRMTVQVLYPITKKQRKFLLKSPKTAESRNTIVNHFKWLQNKKLRPSHVKVPGSRMYDIVKKSIITKNQDTADSGEEPNR